MFKKSTKKIWLSRLLLITMILTLLPASAWAEEPVQPVEIKLPDSIVEALTWQGAPSAVPKTTTSFCWVQVVMLLCKTSTKAKALLPSMAM